MTHAWGLSIANRQRRRSPLAALFIRVLSARPRAPQLTSGSALLSILVQTCGGLFAIIALFHGPPVAALGLGDLRTQSALNQPFYAEIDLFDIQNNALDSLKASLASRSAFEQAGIERPHFLTRLQFTPMIGPFGRADDSGYQPRARSRALPRSAGRGDLVGRAAGERVFGAARSTGRCRAAHGARCPSARGAGGSVSFCGCG